MPTFGVNGIEGLPITTEPVANDEQVGQPFAAMTFGFRVSLSPGIVFELLFILTVNDEEDVHRHIKLESGKEKILEHKNEIL